MSFYFFPVPCWAKMIFSCLSLFSDALWGNRKSLTNVYSIPCLLLAFFASDATPEFPSKGLESSNWFPTILKWMFRVPGSNHLLIWYFCFTTTFPPEVELLSPECRKTVSPFLLGSQWRGVKTSSVWYIGMMVLETFYKTGIIKTSILGWDQTMQNVW